MGASICIYVSMYRCSQSVSMDSDTVCSISVGVSQLYCDYCMRVGGACVMASTTRVFHILSLSQMLTQKLSRIIKTKYSHYWLLLIMVFEFVNREPRFSTNGSAIFPIMQCELRLCLSWFCVDSSCNSYYSSAKASCASLLLLCDSYYPVRV